MMRRSVPLSARSANGLAVAIGGAGVVGGIVGVSSVAASPLVPLGALVAGTGFLAVLRSPLTAVVGFVLAASLLPFAVIPVRLGVSLTLVDVALTLLLLVWVARLLRGRRELITTPIDGLLGLFLGLAIVGFILGSGYAAVGGEQFRLFLKLLNSMLFFYGVVQVVESERDLKRVVRTLLLGGGAAAGIAILLYALPHDVTVRALSLLRPLGYPAGEEVIRTIAGTSTVRATGTSIDPNVLGGLLMLIAVPACAYLTAGTRIMSRPILAGVLAVLVVGIALSYSRSSWVGLAAGVGFIAGFRDRRAWIFAALGMGTLMLLPQGQVLLDRFTSGVAARDQAAAMRLGEYKDALALIAQYPLFGVGFGEAPTIELYVAVSSIYLLIAEEMGLVGLSLFLLVVGTGLVHSFRQGAVRSVELRTAVIAFQATMVAALVAGLFDHYFFNLRFPHMVAMFWLMLALLLTSVRLAALAKVRDVEAELVKNPTLKSY